MDVYIDHESFDTQATTLGGVIAAARDRLSGSGRLIVEVRLDGETLPSDELEEHHEQAITADEVQLITAEPYELARQTLLDIKEALSKLREDQQRGAELLQADRPADALEPVREALQVWQQAQQSVLQATRLLGLELDGVHVAGRSAPQIIVDLADRLKTVRARLLASDWIGLADTLAYELDETAQVWSLMLDTICDQIRQRKEAERTA